MGAKAKARLGADLHRAYEFLESVHSRLGGVKFVEDTRTARIGACFFHLSLEHFASIATLVSHEHFGSAFALMRPQYEALIRGAWFSFAAPDEKVDDFLNDLPLPPVKIQIQSVQAARPDAEGLSDLHQNSWDWLNDYTHGGSTQIKARFQRGVIESAITDEHALTCLDVAHRYGLVAACWMSEIAGRNDLADSFYDQLHEHDARNPCAATTKP